MADGKPGKKKGSPKTGGRKKGTPNVISRDLRSRISIFLDSKWDDACKAWEEIQEPKDKLKLYIDLASFSVPKLQAVSLDATLKKEESSIEEDLLKLSEEE